MSNDKNIPEAKIIAKSKEYANIHMWLRNNYGSADRCENRDCSLRNSKRYEWALLKGKEYKRDRSHFHMLCPSCHRKYDITEETRAKMRKSQSAKTIPEEVRKKISIAKQGDRATPVSQYTKDNVLIAHYGSITEASRVTGCLKSSICTVVRNKAKTSKGFIWKYQSK